MKTRRAQREKEISWAEEYIGRAVEGARASQQKYPASAEGYRGLERGLSLALFIFRCYLRPEHPDVKRVEAARKEDASLDGSGGAQVVVQRIEAAREEEAA